MTPYGLRSLAPSEAAYRGRYEGDGRSRDSVYHQGTVWGWLMGPLVTASSARTGGAKRAAAAPPRGSRPSANTCATRASTTSPKSSTATRRTPPRGCMAQAWSVAEVLRAAVQDVGEVEHFEQ